MQIRVLGCSGSIAAGSRTTSFLLDETVLIDAGTGVGDLTLEEMVRIDHIVVTHSHLDHVLSIGLLADSVTRRRQARMAQCMRPTVRSLDAQPAQPPVDHAVDGSAGNGQARKRSANPILASPPVVF